MRRTPHVCSGTGHGHVALTELLKLQRSGQFLDEVVKIEGAQIHCVINPPDVQQGLLRASFFYRFRGNGFSKNPLRHKTLYDTKLLKRNTLLIKTLYDTKLFTTQQHKTLYHTKLFTKGRTVLTNNYRFIINETRSWIFRCSSSPNNSVYARHVD